MTNINPLGAEFSGRHPAPFIRGTHSCRERGECCTSDWKWGRIEGGLFGGACRNRTCDQLIKSQLLYRLS